ncbi:hypothetical protein EQ836_14685 [Ectopseudomonas mendocina]|uniref:LicD family protein n=1 Tax=Ectopseudomonas mendocina TaxID=300 RepID=A0ABD7RTK1_ECTME|nr:hypothetical protein [Pseudomonas mendocina]TRO07474.1 hypothetical protein EQ829_25510 [Pseudomonas mendocina]TRO16536.1 hypothetical protein EQ836_14685 [Pseudomonas mendocina]
MDEILRAKRYGDYARVEALINEALQGGAVNEARYRELLFLRLDVLCLQKKYEEARDYLDSSGFKEASFAYLKAIRSATDSVSSLPWFEKKIRAYVDTYGGYEHELFNLAVLYNFWGLKDRAFFTLQKRFDYLIAENIRQLPAARRAERKWSALAHQALLDVRSCFAASGLEFFLMSGTLLGVVRDGQLLEHDYDIDIGVDDRVGFESVLSAMFGSGCFSYISGFQNAFVCFMHVNGVKVDIFFHYAALGDTYRHRSRYVAWDNTRFALAETNFLGKRFLVPEDTSQYLTENYGDWSRPVAHYDAYLDTPNLVILCMDDMLFQLIFKMTDAYFVNDVAMFGRLCEKYVELSGDNRYVGLVTDL